MKLRLILALLVAGVCVPGVMAQSTTGNTATGSTSTNTGDGVSQAGAGNLVIQGGGAGSGPVVSGGAGGAGGQGGKGGNADSTSIATGGNAKSNSASESVAIVDTSARSSSNNNGGNVSIETPRNTATAFAPSVYPTVPCFKGIGVAGQGPAFGFSFGGGKVDQNCTILETARSFASVGNRLAYCKVMLTDKYVRKAGVTMEDCMFVPYVDPVITAAVAIQPAPITIVNVPPSQIVVSPAAEVVAPVVIVPKTHKKRVRTKDGCRETSEVVTNDMLECLLSPGEVISGQ